MLEKRVFKPVEYFKKATKEVPVIFLAGPIQGCEDWQTQAIEKISDLSEGVVIASPRRDSLDNFVFDEQVDWETYHLKRAGEKGVVLFWLAKEKFHHCERPFAQTTRFEIAEWKRNHEVNGANLVIGIEDGFTGERYLKRRLSQDSPDIPLFDRLDQTCEKAVEIALKGGELSGR
jgi:hypothetical protein